MINIHSVFTSLTLYIEIICIVSLLKPIKEPYDLRNYWYRLQGYTEDPVHIFVVALAILFINSSLEFSKEKSRYTVLLKQIRNPNLLFEFYMTKITVCYIYFVLTVYLFVIIERLIQFLLIIARLLEFELMCRYGILTQDTQTNNTIVMKGGSTQLKDWLTTKRISVDSFRKNVQ